MKRRELEMLLRSQFQTMVIWTCITGIEVKKWKKNGSQTATGENRAQEDVNDDEGEGECDAENEDVEIKPGISFWIVVDTPQHHLKVMENKIIQVMLTSGLDIDNCRPIKARNKENTASYYAATSCKTNKDHNLKYAEELAKNGAQQYTSSYIHIATGVRLSNDVVPTSEEFGIRQVRITSTSQFKKEFGGAFLKAMEQIKYRNFEYDLVDKRKVLDEEQPSTSSASASQPLQAKPTNKICTAIDVIKRVMEELDARLHRGCHAVDVVFAPNGIVVVVGYSSL